MVGEPFLAQALELLALQVESEELVAVIVQRVWAMSVVKASEVCTEDKRILMMMSYSTTRQEDSGTPGGRDLQREVRGPRREG